MGFLDALFGRSKPAKPDLDQLFALPSAAVTLEVASGFKPTGLGSVSFRSAEGGAFAQIEKDARELVSVDTEVSRSTDSYGYSWLVMRQPSGQLESLVTALHGVNTSLEGAGFGPSLLCSLVGFKNEGGRSLALVYLYKRGTFYPFAPLSGERRDNALELQVKAQIENDLRMEGDLSRWFPVWGAPGL